MKYVNSNLSLHLKLGHEHGHTMRKTIGNCKPKRNGKVKAYVVLALPLAAATEISL